MKYKEIFELKVMLDDAQIPNILRHMPMFNGYQIILETGDDIIEHDGSYGNSEDLLEVMGRRLARGRTGSVEGCLTANKVFKRIMETEWK